MNMGYKQCYSLVISRCPRKMIIFSWSTFFFNFRENYYFLETVFYGSSMFHSFEEIFLIFMRVKSTSPLSVISTWITVFSNWANFDSFKSLCRNPPSQVIRVYGLKWADKISFFISFMALKLTDCQFWVNKVSKQLTISL